MTLTEFLLARVSEDEAVARSAWVEARDPWVASENYGIAYPAHGDPERRLMSVTASGNHGANDFIMRSNQPEGRGLPDHIVRWQPSRVLAECEAKRRLVEHYLNWIRTEPGRTDDWARAARFELEVNLEILVQPYANHSDFQQEWAL